MSLGRLRMNRWNVGLNIEPKIYQTHSYLKKMKMGNKYDLISFEMIVGVKLEE